MKKIEDKIEVYSYYYSGYVIYTFIIYYLLVAYYLYLTCVFSNSPLS